MVRVVRVVMVVEVVAAADYRRLVHVPGTAAERVRGAGTEAARLQLMVQLAGLGAEAGPGHGQRRGGRGGGGREDALAVMGGGCRRVVSRVIVCRMLVVVVEVMVINIDTGRMGVHNIARGGAITAMHPALVQAHRVRPVHVQQVVVVVEQTRRVHHHGRWQRRNAGVDVFATGHATPLYVVVPQVQSVARRPHQKAMGAGTTGKG